jgi:hypothetical protein
MSPFQTIFDAQKACFASGVTRTYAWRVEQLDRMAGLLVENEAALQRAIAADFKTARVHALRGNRTVRHGPLLWQARIRRADPREIHAHGAARPGNRSSVPSLYDAKNEELKQWLDY